MRIPLPGLMRRWREKAFAAKLSPAVQRRGLGLWAFLAKRPALYHPAARAAVGLLALAGRGKGRFRRLPFASGWTGSRDMPAPQGGTFMDQWKSRRRGHAA